MGIRPSKSPHGASPEQRSSCHVLEPDCNFPKLNIYTNAMQCFAVMIDIYRCQISQTNIDQCIAMLTNLPVDIDRC